jgi:hypothetical protein
MTSPSLTYLEPVCGDELLLLFQDGVHQVLTLTLDLIILACVTHV